MDPYVGDVRMEKKNCYVQHNKCNMFGIWSFICLTLECNIIYYVKIYYLIRTMYKCVHNRNMSTEEYRNMSTQDDDERNKKKKGKERKKK